MQRSSLIPATRHFESLHTAQSAVQSFYKPELDVLRFFAFLAVFVFHGVVYSTQFLVQHHVPLWLAKSGLSLVYAGKYGVDLFFVLSAYLITELLLREKDSIGRLDIGAFYLRRMLRIWPLYYLFIALVVFAPFMDPDHRFSLRYVLAFLVLLGNWSFIVFGFANFVAVPLWSIAVEEQFYLFWPPVVAKLSRRQIIMAAIAMIGVANIARFLAVALHQTRIQLWMNTFAHLDSIAAGILLAVLWRARMSPSNFCFRLGLVTSGVACLALVAYFADQPMLFSPLATLSGSPFVPLACTAILISFFGLPFRSGVFQFLGKISYGLYVYHLTGLLLVDKVFPGGKAGAVHAGVRLVLALGATILISIVSYKVVEAPFLRLKKRFTYVRSRPV
jgi:peptidoglycan/LPS O-acetylase OafA/YrhL